MKLLFLLLALYATPIAAQWVPMDVSGASQVDQYERTASGVEFATTRPHLFRRAAGKNWERVVDVFAGRKNYLGDVTAWGTNVAAITGRFNAGPLTSVMWKSTDDGLTWVSQELGDGEYRLIPNSFRAAQLKIFQDSIVSVEIADATNDAVARQEFHFNRRMYSSSLYVASDELVVYEKYYAIGKSRLNRLLDISRPVDEWQVRVFDVYSEPFEIEKLGVCVWNSSSPTVYNDTLFVYNGTFTDTVACSIPPNNFPRYRTVYDNGRYYKIINDTLWSTDSKSPWRPVQKLPIGFPGLITAVYGDDVYAGSTDRAFSVLHRSTGVVQPHNQGLSQPVEGLHTNGNLVVNPQANLSESRGVVYWHDSKKEPNALTFKHPGASGFTQSKLLGDVLWSSNRCAFLNLSSLTMGGDSSGLEDVCTFNNQTLIVRRDSVLEYDPTTNNFKLFFYDDKQGYQWFLMSALGDTLVLINRVPGDLEVQDAEAWLFDSQGALLKKVMAYDSMGVIAQSRAMLLNCGNELAFIEGRNHLSVSDQRATSWSKVKALCANDVGIWSWDPAAGGIWYSKSVSETPSLIPTPPLTNLDVNHVFCTDYNCYASTEAGVYRFARFATSVEEDKQQNVGNQVESELRAWSDGYLNIMDISGRVILSRSVHESEVIETSLLSVGLYFVAIAHGDGVTARTWMVSR